ncbi:MAG: MerR family transcriptional regulator, partial [Vallitaleaceae bacterium]|nr:MerR family transcriptional regulator [Vallitaleaceae bacterium]
NEILKEELTSEVSAHMKSMLSKQEEIEEKRFRKLDETIREIQRGRQEVAVSKSKPGFFTKRKDKPLK